MICVACPFLSATRYHLVSFDNRRFNITIDDLELGALLAQIHLFAPHMPPLTHVST